MALDVKGWVGKRRRWPVVLAAMLAGVSIFFLLNVVVNQTPTPPGKALIIIYAVAIGGCAGVLITMLAGILGWFPQSDTRRRQLADLAHESRYTFRPFWQDLIHSIFSRPAVGFIGLIVASLITIIILFSWPGQNTPGERMGIALGVSGLLFGILGYHVALRVEKSIRDSISDFREFLKVISLILEEEILGEHSRRRRFPASATTEATPTQIPDLILLLWFPYYGLTKDFNQVGLELNSQLSHVQELACRTYLIAAKDPLELMEHFDKQYDPTSKRYDKATLDKVAAAIRGVQPSLWEDKIETLKASASFNMSDPKIERVFNCVSSLKELIFANTIRYWTTIPAENKDLMNGLVQLVWTPRKAAIIFMPPEHIIKRGAIIATAPKISPEGNIVSNDVTPNVDTKVEKAGKKAPYKCSGFVTEDPFMISMIRDLVEIRYGI